jgi:putative transposase
MAERPEQWKWSSYRATAGREKQHPCLSTDWVLGQFSATRGKAEKEYRYFVRGGTGKDSIWTDVKGQAILGEVECVDGLMDYLREHKDVPEIPKGQRYVSRPELGTLFTRTIVHIRETRDRKIAEAVEEYGYTQREVADYLGLHFLSVSRIMRGKREMSRK